MKIADLIRSMSAAGAPPEAIAIAVEAIEGAAASDADRRATEARRSALYRQRGGGAIPEALRMEVFERDGFGCVYCSASADLTCDHVVPVSKGGETTLENLATACRPCNSRKRDRDRKYVQRHSEDKPRTSSDIPRKSDLPPSPKEIPPTPPKEITPTRSSLRSVREQAQRAFDDEFWPAYPRKPGNPRQEAEKRFVKLVEAGEDPVPIVAGARAYAASVAGRDPQYTCSAVVFLNQRRWLDDHSLPAINGARAGPTARHERGNAAVEARQRILAAGGDLF